MPDLAELKELKPEKILFRAPNWLGDSIMALPAMECISKAYPDARITVAAKTYLNSLFSMQKWCSRTIDVSGSVLGMGRTYKNDEYDIAVLFPNSFASALEVFRAGIPVRLGYARDFRSLMLTHPLKADVGLRHSHQVAYYMGLVSALQEGDPKTLAKKKPPWPRIVVSSQIRDTARQFLAQTEGAGDPNESRPFVMAPGAAYGPAKQWPEKHYAELAKKLHSKKDAAVVVVGSEKEKAVCSKIVSMSEGAAVSVAGQTSIAEMAGILSWAAGYAGNDSGASHLAGAVGTHTVVLFGSTEPARTVPLGDNIKPVTLDYPCSPCMKRTCPLGHRNCLRKITPESVMEAITEFGKG